jgi:hypothetical protein
MTLGQNEHHRYQLTIYCILPYMEYGTYHKTQITTLYNYYFQCYKTLRKFNLN